MSKHPMRYLWTVCGGIFLIWAATNYLIEWGWPYRPLDQWDYAWYVLNGLLIFWLCERKLPPDTGFWRGCRTPSGLLMLVSACSVLCSISAYMGHYAMPLTMTTDQYETNILGICIAELSILLWFSIPWERLVYGDIRHIERSHPVSDYHFSGYQAMEVNKNQDSEA